jgi:hypothetical protein
MEVLIHHKAQLDYPLHDVRGAKDADTFKLTWEQAQHRLSSGGRLMFDCSGCVTCIYRWAGLSDPNGLSYKHEGYTGTMLAHLPHYTNPRHAEIGALVVFGPATGEHVAMVLEPSPAKGDPELFSHGARGLTGPILLHAEAKYHDPPVTLLNVSGL